jgi:hypothetical protein
LGSDETAASPRPEFRPERIVALDERLSRQPYDVLTFGDSLLEGWPEADLARDFGASVANVGFGMETMAQGLWRLRRFDPDWRCSRQFSRRLRCCVSVARLIERL